jgi:hypothetical protein
VLKDRDCIVRIIKFLFIYGLKWTSSERKVWHQQGTSHNKTTLVNTLVADELQKAHQGSFDGAP